MVHVESQPSREDCLDSCKRNTNCQWFTYDLTTKICLLMASCDTVDESCEDCFSGEARCNDGKQLTIITFAHYL